MKRKLTPQERTLASLLLFLAACSHLLAWWRTANREPWSIRIESPPPRESVVPFPELPPPIPEAENEQSPPDSTLPVEPNEIPTEE